MEHEIKNLPKLFNEKVNESKYYVVIIIDHFVIATDFENLFFLMNEIMRVDL